MYLASFYPVALQVDANRDGKMTLTEALAAGGSREDFVKSDVDKSGYIAKSELKAFLAEDILKRTDANKDGKMTLAEALAAGGSEEDFIESDVDESGDVVMSELKAFLGIPASLIHESATTSNKLYILGAAVILAAVALLAPKLRHAASQPML